MRYRKWRRVSCKAEDLDKLLEAEEKGSGTGNSAESSDTGSNSAAHEASSSGDRPGEDRKGWYPGKFIHKGIDKLKHK